MPLFCYRCEACDAGKRRICTPEEAQRAPECCGRPMKREARGASARVVESLDNGMMTRKLERLADAERLFHDRAEATKRKMRGD